MGVDEIIDELVERIQALEQAVARQGRDLLDLRNRVYEPRRYNPERCQEARADEQEQGE